MKVLPQPVTTWISLSEASCVVVGIILQLGAQTELVSEIELLLQVKLHSNNTGSEGVKKIRQNHKTKVENL